MANEQGKTPSTDGKATEALYMAASAVLNELPKPAVEKLQIMAKRKFSDQFLAGHNTDKHVSQFCTDYLIDLIAAQYKQFDKQVKAKDVARCAALYHQLRERGVSIEDARKASGYDPLT